MVMGTRTEAATLTKGDGGWARETAVGVETADGLEQ